MRAPSFSMGGSSNDALLFRPLFAILIAVLLLQFASVSVSANSETETLLKIKKTFGHRKALTSWNTTFPLCNKTTSNWKGVICDDEGKVFGLKLENMGLFGTIDVKLLEELPNLKTISFMNNKFNTTLPRLNKMTELKSIYLSGNKFSGTIDADAFAGMKELKKLHLANNELSGPIPSSLTTLQKLNELHLEGNKFSGEIPDFKLGIMKDFNVTNNQLKGPIPQSLKKIDPKMFSGNGDLCGAPLKECASSPPPPAPPTPPPSSSSGMSTKTIIAIVVGVIVLILLLIFIILSILKRRNESSNTSTLGSPARTIHVVQRAEVAANDDLDNVEKGSASSPNSGGSTKKGGENSMKITFLRDDFERFELNDLLKASAEVLGSGYFGASYKAALPSGKTTVVKRFKQMNNVGKEEFQEHMWRIGRLNHSNLLPLVAFYYRKEEKLLVTEYVGNVNLAVHLHGNRSRGHQSPDWPTRLKIVKGVAKGLQYLHTELPSLMLPHGHLKSSNVLLTPSMEPLLTDYALAPVVNQEHAQNVMVAYKSPEYKHNSRVTKKTDVWSFGILIIEILTGKFPTNFLQHGKGSETDLMSWVESILHQEDWSAAELFDKEMGEVAKNSQGEMVKLLKIGLACAESDVDTRLELKEAVSRIEEVKEKDGDNELLLL